MKRRRGGRASRQTSSHTSWHSKYSPARNRLIPRRKRGSAASGAGSGGGAGAVLTAVPFQREPHPPLEGVRGIVAEVAHGGGRVGLGVAHIARAGRTVDGRDLHPFELLYQLPRLVDGNAPAVARVVHIAGDVLDARRLQVQGRHVLHVSEVAR